MARIQESAIDVRLRARGHSIAISQPCCEHQAASVPATHSTIHVPAAEGPWPATIGSTRRETAVQQQCCYLYHPLSHTYYSVSRDARSSVPPLSTTMPTLTRRDLPPRSQSTKFSNYIRLVGSSPRHTAWPDERYPRATPWTLFPDSAGTTPHRSAVPLSRAPLGSMAMWGSRCVPSPLLLAVVLFLFVG